MQKLYFLIIFLLVLTIISCGSPLGKTLFKEQEWSENYALEDGVRCTAPEAIDGDLNTAGKALFPEGVYGKPIIGAFPNAELIITLPNKKTISKIVIHSDDLSDFRVMASAGGKEGQENWKLIKEFSNNSQKEIVIRTSVNTDKILIRARGKAPIQTTESVRVLGGVITSRKVTEPEIKEIELYGFK